LIIGGTKGIDINSFLISEDDWKFIVGIGGTVYVGKTIFVLRTGGIFGFFARFFAGIYVLFSVALTLLWLAELKEVLTTLVFFIVLIIRTLEFKLTAWSLLDDEFFGKPCKPNFVFLLTDAIPYNMPS